MLDLDGTPSLSARLDSPGPHRITVLGGPGSGKTTLLRLTALRLAQRNRLPRRRTVPVLIDLPGHAARIAGGASPAEVIEAATTAAPAGWWASALREGRCVLLLDGLDRVVAPDDRAAVAEWVAAQPAFVVTTERAADAVAGSTTMTMRPPTAGQAQAVVGVPVPPEFRADPLLLTLAATVHKRHGTLPPTPHGLYAAALPDESLDEAAFGLMAQRRWDAGMDRPVQEYRAARHLHRSRHETVLIENLGDEWWREVTLWWATMSDVDPLVEAALASADPSAIALAFRCAEEDERMRAFLATAPRRLVAAVEVDRQLRAFVVTPDGTRRCRNPVSTALYDLFRDDVVVPQPDGPGETQVRGVWDVDAARFVEWADALVPALRLRVDDTAPPRCLVTTQDLVDTVAADVEPMLGHLLSLGIRARSVVLERMLSRIRRRAGLVLTGFRSRYRGRLTLRLDNAETRLNDLQSLSPRELGLGIMQVNAERRELVAAIGALREQIRRLDDPRRVDENARRDEPNWQWAQRIEETVEGCAGKAGGLFPGLGTGSAIVDVDAALGLDRLLHELHIACADLDRRLDPKAIVGAATYQAVQSTGRDLQQALDDARLISAALDAITATTLPTRPVEPLIGAVTGPDTPDLYDPARSAAAALQGGLGPAFASGMALLLGLAPTAPRRTALGPMFARGLVKGAGLTDGDTVTVRLGECAAAVAEMYTRPVRNRLRQRFLATAGPVFYRSAPRDATTLAETRFYALILAGGRSAEVMRHLAAATVALGRPADETLVLLQD